LSKEHSWQVQLPFLKHLGITNIAVILVGNHATLPKIKIPENTLLIGTTDLLHCGPNYKSECKEDIDAYNRETINMIKNKNLDDNRDRMCGREAILAFLKLTKNYKFKHCYYKNNRFGDNSVGYMSMTFVKQQEGGQKIHMLKIPRDIMEFMNKNDYEKKDIPDILKRYTESRDLPILSKGFGIFPTIEEFKVNEWELRGCIGTFDRQTEVGKLIADRTLYSAFKDDRSPPISKSELGNLKYKVNFLNEPFVIYEGEGKTPDELFDTVKHKMVLGTHGLTLYFGERSATYLASVFTEGFNIKVLTNDNWKNKVVESLKDKSLSNTKQITKIKLYVCKEFKESEIELYDNWVIKNKLVKDNQEGGINSYYRKYLKYKAKYLRMRQKID